MDFAKNGFKKLPASLRLPHHIYHITQLLHTHPYHYDHCNDSTCPRRRFRPSSLFSSIFLHYPVSAIYPKRSSLGIFTLHGSDFWKFLLGFVFWRFSVSVSLLVAFLHLSPSSLTAAVVAEKLGGNLHPQRDGRVAFPKAPPSWWDPIHNHIGKIRIRMTQQRLNDDCRTMT